MSLRTRLLVGLAVLVLAAVASAGVSVLAVARARLEEAEDARAAAVGAQLVALLERACDDRCSGAAVGPLVRALVDGGAAPELLVVDGDRHVIAGAGPAGAAAAAAAAADVRLGGALAGIATSWRDDALVYYYAPLRAAGRAVAAARVRLPGGADVAQALRRARVLLAGVTLFDGGLVLLFGALFIRRVVEPIAQLSHAARRIAAGELDVPPLAHPLASSVAERPAARADEVARLVDDFNRMTASLRAQRDHLVAQEKLVTVGRLAAGVAHEIGNPLAAVLGYADLLLHDEPPDGPRRDALERIRRETDRIRGIVADLVDYARPVTGALEPVSLGEVVEAALSLVRPQARFRGVSIEREVPVDLPRAAASASRITQVVLNLLLNAADAVGGSGSVRIVAASDGDRVELRVRDDGPGVPAADRERIFDPFFTTKEPGKGTGLGLSVSRQIAEAFGGTLTLAAGEGGACFVLVLPRWTDSAPGTPGSAEATFPRIAR